MKNSQEISYGYHRVERLQYIILGREGFSCFELFCAFDADFAYRGGTERSASILLKEGLHPFSLYYMRDWKSQPSMDFEWSEPGIGKKLIPGICFSEISSFQYG